MGVRGRILSAIVAIILAAVCAKEPSDREIQKLVDDLWLNDNNKAREGQIKLSFQGKTGYEDQTDRARNKLFTFVDNEILKRPTYAALIKLYPYFDPKTGNIESSSNAKNRAIEDFLEKVVNSKTMETARLWLKDKASVASANSKSSFKAYLKELWFDMYSREKGVQDSSSFEHIFMGELKHGKRMGLHNWVRVYWLENEGDLNYAGYNWKRDHLISVSYEIDRSYKASSFFLGSSPEFDFAVFTLCYLTKQGNKRCKFEMPDCTKVQVTTHKLTQNRRNFIGSAYPSKYGTRTCDTKHYVDDSSNSGGSRFDWNLLGIVGLCCGLFVG